MSAPALAAKVRRLLGIDRAVGFALLSRGWSALAGLLTLALLVRFFSPAQQGYYSVFGSLMAVQVFFELGVGLVLLQFASHERARLEWSPGGTLEGDPVAKARLSSLLRRGLVWYGTMALLLIVTVFPAGMLYLHKYQRASDHVQWQGPWIVFAVSVALGVVWTPLWTILEGCGLVAEVTSAQFVSSVLYSLLFWLMLTRHLGLYAMPIGGMASTAWVMGWMWFRRRRFLADLLRCGNPNHVVSWRHEMWPFQWKIALSWLGGYFIYQTFVPLLLASHGAVAAGRLGLSLTIAASLGTIAIAWVSTKAAPFGSLVARREWAQMDRMFFPALWLSTAALVLADAGFWLLTVFLGHHAAGYRLSHRLLPPLPLGLLLLAMVTNHFIGAQGIYLRAHKQEPFLWLSVTGGLLVCLSSYVLGSRFGAVGMMAGYLAVSLVVGLGLGTTIFLRKRREWHDDGPGNGPDERKTMEERQPELTTPQDATPVLSLCVPTYKRASLLPQSLRSVLSQITPDLAPSVEVVILDNASPDDTPSVVAQMQAEFPDAPVRYVRRPQNIGADANMCDAPNQARGEFVYLISDDDVLLPGAVERLLQLIHEHPELDGFTLNVREFWDHPDEDTVCYFTKPDHDHVLARDEALPALNSLLIFLSCLAFRRESVAGRDYSRFRGTYMAQAYMFLDALSAARGLYVTRRPYLARRADNHEGYRFFQVFVTHWAALMRYAESVGFPRETVRRTMTNYLGFLLDSIVLFKSRGAIGKLGLSGPQSLDAAARLVRAYGWERSAMTILLPRLLMPRALYASFKDVGLWVRVRLGRPVAPGSAALAAVPEHRAKPQAGRR